MPVLFLEFELGFNKVYIFQLAKKKQNRKKKKNPTSASIGIQPLKLFVRGVLEISKMTQTIVDVFSCPPELDG